ncbi:putative Peptide-N4-(N-acetyl-beta-glucosaminyl)asparagine amidase A [Glarea lozoyensis 74030]|uniref:Putative Peptide-N4-(N-acetyl-beta-glucosaminyl)asparagine amidase A n=1 Tax=Glarea lozoyensis (strain ATCC 74030 / MF5533) TaxID=1104152 RepID=H0EYN5_GLAL7|nr:putative Peptide-N4-(N-acetyl-beta-glucosaminyl)asparagine amidase A [Glarea lozoyensis 74030]
MAAKTQIDDTKAENLATMEQANGISLSPREKGDVHDLEYLLEGGEEKGGVRTKHDCFITNDTKTELAVSSSKTFKLVKDAIQVTLATPATAVLECFQVYQPVLFPKGAVDQVITSDGTENTTIIAPSSSNSSCQVLLMDHSFGYSYGMPFVGNYTPPKCKFNRVAMNFTVTSRGRQYDRLAIMYFNDTEVWRTSTAEPTTNGIRWEYIKDMTEYLYFWNSPQTLIFDLGNLVNDVYTGSFNTTLTATFFTVEEDANAASLILPISARKGSTNSASVFMLPSDTAVNTLTLPQNVNRAVFSISACGQSTEEFWWGNVLQSNINTFVPYDGTLYGYSPFREVQVLIDGQLAGVQWPFPVIFTGGVVPGLWRPIVGIDAFDLREHEIDITPWLPILSDGKSHSFEIRVVGLDDDGETGTLTQTVGSSWYVTGKIFIWQDSPSAITSGREPTVLLPAPVISISQTSTQSPSGANETLEYTINVSRTLSISSLLTTETGTRLVSWTQSLSVKNYGLYTLFGAIQVNNQTTTGLDQSTGGTYYKSSYSYPLYANTTYLVDASTNFTIAADLSHGLNLDISGSPVFPTGLQPFHTTLSTEGLEGTSLSTTQNGTAFYAGSPSTGTSSGYGSTSQDFRFAGVGPGARELYTRSVEAVNGSVVRDRSALLGASIGGYRGSPPLIAGGRAVVEGVVSAKEVLGRGRGGAKEVLVQAGVSIKLPRYPRLLKTPPPLGIPPMNLHHQPHLLFTHHPLPATLLPPIIPPNSNPNRTPENKTTPA